LPDWSKRERPGIKGRTSARMDAGVAGSVGGVSAMVPETETSFHSASRRARDMASWNAWRISPDAALLPEQDTINARVEDLVRNNGIASGARRTLTDNVIGPRITCKPNPDRIMLGRDPEWVQGWSRQVEAEWNTFADSTWFDAGGRHTFHSATRLAVRSLATNGEALALPVWIVGNGRGDSSRWFTRLQMVHPARLSNPYGQQDSPTLRAGIELNEYGEAIAYNIRQTHPGDWGTLAGSVPVWERIEAAQAWGRIRVLHLYDQDDIGQSRGLSVFAPVLRQFQMLSKYHLEALRLAVLDNMVFMALETPLDQQGIVDLFGSGENPMEAYFQSLQEWQVNMRGGAIIPMPPGTTSKPFTPQRSNSELDSFSTAMMRQIATGIGSSYELLNKDFSKTNYSSARAALLEDWRYFNGVRQLLIDHWIRPIYDLWFEEAVNRGRIPDCTPADYYANQVAWTRSKWLFAPRGWVDPLKEARGASMRKEAGLATLEDLVGEQGMDWTDFLEQQKRENDLAAELGLPLPHVAKGKAAPGDSGAGGDQQQSIQDAVDEIAA
jgi:lambda family phage portal protein